MADFEGMSTFFVTQVRAKRWKIWNCSEGGPKNWLLKYHSSSCGRKRPYRPTKYDVVDVKAALDRNLHLCTYI